MFSFSFVYNSAQSFIFSIFLLIFTTWKMKKEYSEKLCKWSSQVVNVGTSVKSTRKYRVIKVCYTLTQSVCGLCVRVCVCVCVRVWIQTMIMMQPLLPWEIICQPQALDTALEGEDLAWLLLDYFSYLPQQFPLLAESITKLTSVVFLFLEGLVTSFLG